MDLIARMMARHIPAMEISRFALVGCANTLIDFCVFLTLARGLHLPLVAANLGAWLTAFCFSFLVNGRWTFGLAWARLLRPRYFAGLALASLMAALVTTSVLLLSAPHLPLALAKILSIAVGFLLNYGLAKRASLRQ